LEKSIFARTLGNFRSLSERKASVSALATFRQVTGGKAAVARVRRKLNAELREAKDTEERSGLRELLTLLDG
jgi:sigma54-dependent transcription regulator